MCVCVCVYVRVCTCGYQVSILRATHTAFKIKTRHIYVAYELEQHLCVCAFVDAVFVRVCVQMYACAHACTPMRPSNMLQLDS